MSVSNIYPHIISPQFLPFHNSGNQNRVNIISSLFSYTHQCVKAHQTKRINLRVVRAIRDNDVKVVLAAVRSRAFDISYIHEGASIFHRALKEGNKKIIKVLIIAGADINKILQDNQSPIEVCCNMSHFNAAFFLLGFNKIDFRNIPQKILDLLLYKAAGQGCFSIVEKLVKNKANINSLHGPLGEQKTPLEVASIGLYYQIVRYLLQQEEIDLKKLTHQVKAKLLHFMIEINELSLVQKLVDGGADINSTNEEGQTPVEVALSASFFRILWYLCDQESLNLDHIPHETKISIAFHAIKVNYKIIKKLLEGGLDPNSKNSQNLSLLMEAVKVGDLNILELLLETPGINIDLTGSSNNKTALHFVIYGQNREKKLELLLRNKANINAQNDQGETILSKTARLGHSSVKLLLIHPDVQVNLRDRLNKSAIEKALNFRHYTTVWLLLDVNGIELDTQFAFLLLKKISESKDDDENEILVDVFFKSFFRTKESNKEFFRKAFQSIIKEPVNPKLQVVKKCLDGKITHEEISKALELEEMPYIPSVLKEEISQFAGVLL